MAGHKGFFYHFLNNEDGTRRGKTELSTVDTSLLLGGVLFAQSYYDADTPVEAEIRDLAEKIYARVDWTFVQRENSNIPSANGGGQTERTRVVKGKRVSVRVDLGGRRIIKKKK